MNKRIFLSPPSMYGKEEEFVTQAFRDNWIAPAGPNLSGFESDVCNYTGAEYAVALASGTASIHLALKYVGVEKDDIVFCSDLTFSGSCNPVIYEKAKPVFIDSEEGSFNMSPDALEKAFEEADKRNKLPKAVIVVDLYGISADYDRILPICEKYGVPVIEDAAEALGSKYKGESCGTFGKIGIYSFNGNKIITTSGGGMAVSSDEQAIKKINFWANQSKENVPYYYHKELGYNYRMSNVCAGIGRGQMLAIDEKISKRKEIYMKYKESLNGLPVSVAQIPDYCEPNYWLTVLFVDKTSKKTPDDLVNALADDNIEARRAWNPMHNQPFFSECEFYSCSEKSVSDKIFENGVCMPSGDAMTSEDFERIVNVVKNVF